jgi:hypothetical protein
MCAPSKNVFLNENLGGEVYVIGTDHRVVIGCSLVEDLLSAIQGTGTKGKPRWIDELALRSELIQEHAIE